MTFLKFFLDARYGEEVVEGVREAEFGSIDEIFNDVLETVGTEG